MSFIDLLIVFILVLTGYAEARRGLLLALFDILRIALGLSMGLVAYRFGWQLTHNYGLGLAGFLIVALAVVGVLASLMKASKIDPEWARKLLPRALAGVIGLCLGFAVCAVVIPVLGRSRSFQDDVERAHLARPFVQAMPGFYQAADAMNLDLPQLDRRPIRFADEGKAGSRMFAERINFTRLDGSMCIQCRSPVRFIGYKLRDGLTVSPEFQCPFCGRTSDGCQTFEGFHRMYHHCSIEVAKGLIGIDCGVWPNNRPVQPVGICPVCGRIGLAISNQ